MCCDCPFREVGCNGLSELEVRGVQLEIGRRSKLWWWVDVDCYAENGFLVSVCGIRWALLIRRGVCGVYDIFHPVDQRRVVECFLPGREVFSIFLEGGKASLDPDVYILG